MTNVPSPTLGPTGYVIPDEAAILQGVCQDLQAIFGGGLNLDPIGNPSSLTTPQGQLATTVTAIIADCFTQFLQVVSQYDPQYAQGRAQDALGNLYGMVRQAALGTQVSGTCNGLAGTVIPAGVPVAQDAAGNLYTTAGGTIPAGGLLPLVFVNQETGALPFVAPLTIYQTTPGWDLITGATQASLGQDAETQQAFEARRQASVAANAQGILPAVRAAVLASGQTLSPPSVPADCQVAQNTTDAPATVNGVTLAPHSIYVSVRGGDAAAIAQAIWTKTSGGCDFNGATTVQVPDPSYSTPRPTYPVSFQEAAPLPCYVAVDIVNNPALPANIVTLIQNAVAAQFPATIGAPVYASALIATIQACAPGLVNVLSVQIDTSSTPATPSVSPTLAQYVSVPAANVLVTLT